MYDVKLGHFIGVEQRLAGQRSAPSSSSGCLSSERGQRRLPGEGLTVNASRRLETLLNLLPRNDMRTHIP
jgi:hypothetical protein